MNNNNRRASRFPTTADVEFDIHSMKTITVKYSGGSLIEETVGVQAITGVGVALNLSTTGLKFTTQEPIELNTQLRCFIYMKKGNRIVKLRCEGPVVRVVQCQQGFAINPDDPEMVTIEECENCWEIAISFTTLDW